MVRILLVDDDARSTAQISKQLEARGYEVLAADDGAAALRTFDPSAVDLVLCNANLPDMDSAACVQRLRALVPRLPVIALTGAGADTTWVPTERARPMAAHAVMLKPVDFYALIAVVRAMTACL